MTRQISLFEEEKVRQEAEDTDNIKSVMPPKDIVAFNELRSCADIYRLKSKKQLDLNPDFQRGIVWSNKSQTLFVDSLIKQLPIPSLCISLDITTQKRLVIDGLQRISTIVKFLDEDEDWKLSKTDDVDDRISGKKRSEIQRDNNDLYEIFENATIPVTVLRCDYSNKTHMEYLFQIFHRLNSGGNKLFNQEIRNCIYQGTLNTFLKHFVRTDIWKTFTNLSDERIEKSRFANEELLLRFYAFYFNLAEYKGRLALFLNNFMEINKEIDEATIQSYSDIITSTIELINRNLLSEVRSLSKTVIEALLIGISKNLVILNDMPDDIIKAKLQEMLDSEEFSQEELSENLSQPEKVKARLNKAISIFSK
ncbi:MAG TPA: DUF262 domain-containing protein [Prolixibacteraceae bacterium]|nr:DUF262 domain-containing protein [Prolixibacteraceae bacterium]